MSFEPVGMVSYLCDATASEVRAQLFAVWTTRVLAYAVCRSARAISEMNHVRWVPEWGVVHFYSVYRCPADRSECSVCCGLIVDGCERSNAQGWTINLRVCVYYIAFDKTLSIVHFFFYFSIVLQVAFPFRRQMRVGETNIGYTIPIGYRLSS